MNEEHTQNLENTEQTTAPAVTPEVAGTPEEAPVADAKAMISYGDFAKLDIALGVIQSVEVVEGADKLLRLMVDVGEATQRQIVSGIREYFEDPQELVGRQCPFLVNLEPRTIRGLESQGMILAAERDGVFALLLPHNELPAGTRIN